MVDRTSAKRTAGSAESLPLAALLARLALAIALRESAADATSKPRRAA